MAEILKCSPATIHSVESGRLRLSESLARTMSHQTGVALPWLLDGNPAAPPVDTKGQPYSLKAYARAREKKVDQVDKVVVHFNTLIMYAAMRSLLQTAVKTGDLTLATYKLGRAINQIAEEFKSAKPDPFRIDARSSLGSMKYFVHYMRKNFSADLSSTIFRVPEDKLPELATIVLAPKKTKPPRKKSTPRRARA